MKVQLPEFKSESTKIMCFIHKFKNLNLKNNTITDQSYGSNFPSRNYMKIHTNQTLNPSQPMNGK